MRISEHCRSLIGVSNRFSVAGRYQRSEVVFFFLVIAYVALAYVASYAIGHAEQFSASIYAGSSLNFLLPVAVIALGFRVLYVMVKVRPKALFAYIFTDIRSNLISVERIRHVLPMAFVLAAFVSVFTSVKSMIPAFNAFQWDYRLMMLDQVLHFGRHPWELLQPLFGYPLVTFMLNVAYNIWFFVMLLFLFWQAFTLRDRVLRMQFFYTFFLIWFIGGNLLAIAFSSVGPCFFGALVNAADPYRELMGYLAAADKSYSIWALDAQQILLKKHAFGTAGVGAGISAMPSMHVATATLFALMAFRIHPALAVVMVLYAMLIYLGSIHLGWHYAVDGIVGFVLAVTVWFGIGLILQAGG